MRIYREMEGSGSRPAYDIWHRSLTNGQRARAATLHPWHENALELLGQVEGLRVLEVGCGKGDFALRLVEERPRVIFAMDFSAPAVAMANSQAKGLANVGFVVGDAENLPFKPR